MTSAHRVFRSDGVTVAPFGDGLVAYDPFREVVHLLSPLGSWVLASEHGVAVDDLVAELAEASGASLVDAARRVDDVVDSLGDLGLINSTSLYQAPGRWLGSTEPREGWRVGPVHHVIERRVAFRSNSAQLLADADAFWGEGDVGAAPDTFIDLEDTGDGGVTAWAMDRWTFPERIGLFRQFTDIMNEYAARQDSILVLHAGGVRTPDGRVILMPGVANAGKSTLTAALLLNGCDYLGDEAIGVRSGAPSAVAYPKPLALDAASLDHLGISPLPTPDIPLHHLNPSTTTLTGDCGPIDEVIFPVFRSDAATTSEALDPEGALRELVAHNLNLTRCGQTGLQALADLAQKVPATRLAHGDARALAAELVAGRRI